MAALFGLLVFALVVAPPFSSGTGTTPDVFVELVLESAEDGETKDQFDGASAAITEAANILDIKRRLIGNASTQSLHSKKKYPGNHSQTRAPPVRI